MKRWFRVGIVRCFVCLLFFSCLAANAGLAEGDGPDSLHPLSDLPVFREMIEEINQLDDEMAQMGYYALPTALYLSLVESEEPYAPIDESRLPVQGDSVELTLAARIEERENNGSTAFSAVALLTVNGRVVDFELDGSRSEDGLLCTTLQSNRDYLLPFRVDHLPVAEGENELMLAVMCCCPEQELFLDAFYLNCGFRADRAFEGEVIAPCPEKRIDRVITVRSRKDAPELMSRQTVAPGEQLAFESDHRGHVLIRTKPAPTLHFYIDDMSMSDIKGQRAGLMLLFVDGRLQPVWDGGLIGEIRLQEGDLMKAIVLKTDFGPGERHSVCWHYIETESADEWKAPDHMWFTVETR